ncbi:YjaG family protein [Thalassotalea aquiviva]|uniref:YjaG family protein n=1 Tax=Thalassotalea aquiviva TaxID=3242415 RepID=UPI00352A3EA6
MQYSFLALEYKVSIKLPLNTLSFWQQTAFAACLLERMLPNYAMFSEAVEFGDANLLRNQLNLIWQRLEQGQIKINYAAQLEKLEDIIPDVDDYDFFGVYPALDTCMAMGSLLQGMQDNDDSTLLNVPLLSINSVRHYVQLLLAQEHQQQEEIVLKEADIEEHPLMVWERETQQEAFDVLQQAAQNKSTCQQLKALVLEEKISNLGIEY